MAREILFRGKRANNGEWVEGYYAKSGGSFILQDNGLTYGGFEMFEVSSETVCQYTGLADKNGRKIFEGDIVKLPKCENNIAFFVLEGCNYFLKGKQSDYVLGSCKSECFEVIGNIFDNPNPME